MLMVVFIFSLMAAPALAESVPLPAADQAAVDKKSLREFLIGSESLGWADLDWETDLYYSNVSLNIPLTAMPIRETTGQGELKVYSQLFLDSLVPRYLLLEAAVMPLPLLGVGLKEYGSDIYTAGDIGGSQNLIQWITAGFEEPYAFSLFVGEMVRFSKQGEGKLSSNKGYMGYLLSYSNQHIKNNQLVPDHSLEAEWKLKGERSFKDDRLSWSFRVGAKLHQHQDIANTFYVGFRRSDLDFKVNPIDFLKNSTFDVRWDFSQKNGALLRQEYVLGKRFPVKTWGVAFKFDAGVIWEDPARYSGVLRDRNDTNFTVVLRPNLLF